MQAVQPISRLRKLMAMRNSWSQSELNHRCRPPVLHLSTRYVNALSNFFVAMLYASQIPLGLLWALLALVLQYGVDRWNVLRYYRRPPRTDHTLALRAFKYLPWAVWIHLCLVGYAYVLGPWCDGADPTVSPRPHT